MQRENIDKARKIIKLIDDNKRVVDRLEKYTKYGHYFYTDLEQCADFEFELTNDDIKALIDLRVKKVEELEKELEEL